jgi:hypothetical protein
MKSLIALFFTIVFSTNTFAAGQVQQYCIWDYFRFCSQYSLDSKEVKQCMANAGVNLSKGCIRAIVADGYVTKQDVIKRGKEQGYIVAETKNGLDIIGTIPKKQVLLTKATPSKKVTKKKKKIVIYKKPKPDCKTDIMQSQLTGNSFFKCK